MTAIHFTCPRCHATPGVRCTNYTGTHCAPHRDRTHANAQAADLKAEADWRAENQPKKPAPPATLF